MHRRSRGRAARVVVLRDVLPADLTEARRVAALAGAASTHQEYPRVPYTVVPHAFARPAPPPGGRSPPPPAPRVVQPRGAVRRADGRPRAHRLVREVGGREPAADRDLLLR